MYENGFFARPFFIEVVCIIKLFSRDGGVMVMFDGKFIIGYFMIQI
jgi:hypothetical protein